MLAALIYISKSLITFISFLFLSFLLLPPVMEKLQRRIKYVIPPKAKITAGIIIFFVAVYSAPAVNNEVLSTTAQLEIESRQVKENTGPIDNPSPTNLIIPIATLKPVATQTISPYYSVLRVIDGDTVDVEIGGKKETLRLIGIDTPETVDPRKSIQCFGKEASTKARELLNDQKVRIEADSSQGERDKYGRLLRYIFIQNGTNFNEYMIKEGYAHEYTYQSNPYKYQQQFKNAEREARDNGKGLWAADACSSSTTTSTTTAKASESSVNTGSYQCNCSKTCGQMSSCEEAYYQLNQCGCYQRDGDSDGIPCESSCR